MKRLVVAATVAALITSACSGNGAGSGSGVVPGPASQGSTMVRRPAAVAAAPAGWATTGTQALSLRNASDTGPLAPSTTLTIRVGMQLRNATQLQQLVGSGQTLSNAAFMSTYAPTAAQVSAVQSYLQSQGFSNITVEPNNLIVSGTASAAKAAAAFDTALESYTQNGVSVYANTKPAYVPQALAGTVVAVLGLNNAAKATAKHPSKPTSPPPATQTSVTPCTAGVSSPACLRFYDPATYGVTYDVGTTPTGANTAVAIMAEGNVTPSIADLRTNESKFHLPQVPVSVMHVGLASPDTAGDDEWTLDMTYSSGMAGNLRHIYLYDTTSLTDSDIALEYNHWVTDHLAPIGNSSFGGCEYGPYLDGSMLLDDEILLQGASQGQTMFVSTGDSGGFCGVGVPNGVPAGAPLVEYPSASPYVVAVGGTDLYSNANGSYLGETSWEAGGGGLSQFEYSPYWESGIQPVSSTPAGFSFRGLPDIAMDASLETGALLYTSGSAANGSCTPCITGGTSLASPLAAGAYARMQTAHNNTLGFAPPLLYRIYTKNPNAVTVTGPPPTQTIGGFHDIITGSNVTYQALPRYDYTTGMGSLDIAVTNAQIGR